MKRRTRITLIAVPVLGVSIFAASACGTAAGPAVLSDMHACQLLKPDLAASSPDSVRLMGDEAIAVSALLKNAIGVFIEAYPAAVNPFGQLGPAVPDPGGTLTAAANVISTACTSAGVPGVAALWTG